MYGHIGTGGMTGGRAGEEDVPFAALDHARQDHAGQRDLGGQVDGDGPIQIGLIGLIGILKGQGRRHDPGAVHQQVDRLVFVKRGQPAPVTKEIAISPRPSHRARA